MESLGGYYPNGVIWRTALKPESDRCGAERLSELNLVKAEDWANH